MGTRCWFTILVLPLLHNLYRGEFFVKGDTFASIAQMEQIINLEMTLSKSLERFVELERSRLDKVKQFSTSVKEAMNQVKIEGPKSLGNPATSYAVIKRFANGWTELGNFLKKDYSNDLRNLLQSNKWQFPNHNEDLVGAMAALFRLQDTYNISAVEMADNNIIGCGAAPKLLAEDCFDLGTVAYQAGRYTQAREWLSLAETFIHKGRHDGAVNRTEVLEYLAWIEYVKGNPERALNLTLEILQSVPHNKQAKANVIHYREMVEQGTRDTHDQIKAKEEEINTNTFKSGKYATLCRGDTSQSTPQGNLNCWYHGQKSPLLLLRPIKVEMVWRKPELLIFRNLLSTKEAERIKELATPKLQRATVFNRQTGKLENADYRVSKSAWLESWDDEVIATVDRRIGAATGLEMDTAEPLQIANYGMAGQYEFHHDFGDPGSPLDLSPNGNRIATVLIYLNDVSRGGYTVFTRAKTYVSPTMGDAAFWYNLKRSGEGDYETEHAACPVLCGNKWVANKWLHIRGQEFRRKCSLNPKE